MTRLELIAICERLGACCAALDWLRSQTYETAFECWAACERGDWMIWLLTVRPGIVPERTLRLIAVDCARAAQPIADEWFAKHAPQHVGAGVRLLDLIEYDHDADPQTWSAAWSAASAASAAALSSSRAAASDARAGARAYQSRTVRSRVEWADVERVLREVVP